MSPFSPRFFQPPAGAAAAFASGEFVLDGAPCAPAELIQESASAWGGSFPAAPEPTVATTAAAGDDRPARARGSGAAADDAAAPEAGVAPAPAPPPPPRLPPPPPGAGGFVRVVLTEGRHHQVKRMLSAAGCGRTLALHRSQFAGYALETLQPGQVAVLPLPPAGGWVREGWPGGGGGEGDGAAGEGGAGE